MRLTLLLNLAVVAVSAWGDLPPLDHADPMRSIDSEGKVQPVKTAQDWENRRNLILKGMQEAMGPLPDGNRKVSLELRITQTVELDGYTRKTVTFAVEKGDRLPAYLLIPHNLRGKAPAILCLHQTVKVGKGSPAGIGDKPSLAYAVELAQRGYITLAPDYPGFGDSQTDPYALGYVSGTMKGIWNHMRCVDLLQSLEEVDGQRIGCIGHSLGGHNTLFVAAFDPRIKAAVSNCGFTSFSKYYNGNLTGWSSKTYMPRIASVYNKDPKKMPFDFPEVLAAIAPRAVMVIAPLHDANFEVSGVRDSLAAATPVYELLGAKDKLVAIYPESAHEFTAEARKAAYAFFDANLKGK